MVFLYSGPVSSAQQRNFLVLPHDETVCLPGTSLPYPQGPGRDRERRPGVQGSPGQSPTRGGALQTMPRPWVWPPPLEGGDKNAPSLAGPLRSGSWHSTERGQGQHPHLHPPPVDGFYGASSLLGRNPRSVVASVKKKQNASGNGCWVSVQKLAALITHMPIISTVTSSALTPGPEEQETPGWASWRTHAG